jgi:hypothetical protein
MPALYPLSAFPSIKELRPLFPFLIGGDVERLDRAQPADGRSVTPLRRIRDGRGAEKGTQLLDAVKSCVPCSFPWGEANWPIDAKTQFRYFSPFFVLRATDGRHPDKPRKGGCMGDLFKGWQRKVGVVTLFLALVFTGGWVKSGTDATVICVPNGNLTDELPMSGRIGVFCSSDHIEENREVPGFQLEVTGLCCDLSLPASKESKESEDEPTLKLQTDIPGVFADFGFGPGLSDEDRSKLQSQIVHVDMNNLAEPEAIEGLSTSRWQRCGFYVNRISIADGHWQTSVLIPYWSIVIPLALLSAVLLIKPRSAKLRLERIPVPSF